MFGGNFAPANWAFCNGQIMLIVSNTALFSLLRTMYGGDGRTTFALPNLQDRFPINAGQGPGMTDRPQGEAGGSITASLNTEEMAPHSHVPNANTAGSNTASPAGAVWGGSSIREAPPLYAPAPANTPMAQTAISATGGSLPHPNVQPYLAVSYIISLAGIFPARP